MTHIHTHIHSHTKKYINMSLNVNINIINVSRLQPIHAPIKYLYGKSNPFEFKTMIYKLHKNWLKAIY